MMESLVFISGFIRCKAKIFTHTSSWLAFDAADDVVASGTACPLDKRRQAMYHHDSAHISMLGPTG
jgi:hypothetical protein